MLVEFLFYFYLSVFTDRNEEINITSLFREKDDVISFFSSCLETINEGRNSEGIAFQHLSHSFLSD